MSVHTWSVAQAKAKFSEVIEKAKAEGPQIITRHGRKAAVLVAADEWERKTRPKESLAEFFARSPLRGSGIDLDNLRIRLRKPEP
jgi:prevent-host-death family protein